MLLPAFLDARCMSYHWRSISHSFSCIL
jgi:hypothetical protein